MKKVLTNSPKVFKRYLRRYLFWGSGIFCLLFANSCFSAQFYQLVDRIVATVNGKIISEKELEKEILWYQKEWGLEREEIKKKEVLELLIDKELLLEKAKEREITVTKEEVEERFSKYEKQFSSENLEKILKDRGTSLEEFKERLRDEILQEKLIIEKMREINRDIEIKEEEIKKIYQELKQYMEGKNEIKENIRKFYQTYQKELEEKSLVKIAYIVEKDEKKAEDIYQKLKKNGDSFSFLREGWINLREINPSLREEILNLKENEISKVEVEGTFYILKLIERRKFSFEEFKDKIETYLRRRKATGSIEKWIEDLRLKARIEILV